MASTDTLQVKQDLDNQKARANFPNELNSIPIPMRPVDTSIESGINTAIAPLVESNGLPPINLDKPAYGQGQGQSLDGQIAFKDRPSEEQAQNPVGGSLAYSSKISTGPNVGMGKIPDPTIQTTESDKLAKQQADLYGEEARNTQEANRLALDETIKADNALKDAYTAKKDAMARASKELDEKYAKLPIPDPNKFWSSASTLGKIGMIIGMISDAAYAEVRDPKESFRARLDKIIETDYQAQKDQYNREKGKADNQYANIMKVVDNDFEAEKMFRMNGIDAINKRLALKLSSIDPKSKQTLIIQQAMADNEKAKNGLAQELYKSKFDQEYKRAQIALENKKLGLEAVKVGIDSQKLKNENKKLSAEKATKIGFMKGTMSGIQKLKEMMVINEKSGMPYFDSWPASTNRIYHQLLIETGDNLARLRSGGAVTKEEDRKYAYDELARKALESPKEYEARLDLVFKNAQEMNNALIYGESYK